MAYADPAAKQVYAAEYYIANREKFKTARDKYYADNREKVLAQQREYYVENREKFAAYRKANIDRSRAKEAERVRRNREKVMLKRARFRARTIGHECSISEHDIVIPDTCPVLGIPLYFNPKGQTANSPSLDRIDSSKGYVRGNVIVISHRANRLKGDASIEELQAIVGFYRWLLPEKEKGPGFSRPSTPSSYDNARPRLALTNDMADELTEVN